MDSAGWACTIDQGASSIPTAPHRPEERHLTRSGIAQGGQHFVPQVIVDEITRSCGELDQGRAKSVAVTAVREGADPVEFEAVVRLDTPNEIRYFQNGGILQTVLRDLKAA